MAKFTIKATLTKTYEISVEADNEMDAIKKIDHYWEDDFEGLNTGACWNFEAAKSTNS